MNLSLKDFLDIDPGFLSILEYICEYYEEKENKISNLNELTEQD